MKPLFEGLSEQQILAELEQYRAFYQSIESGHEGGRLPREGGPSGMRLVLGLMLHLVLSLVSTLFRGVRFSRGLQVISTIRVRYDAIWYEPQACGLSRSLTDLGLSYLWMGLSDDAVKMLDLSYKVHPCPHNTTFGMPRRLRLEMSKRGVNSDAAEIRRFDSWSRKFSSASRG